jgi:hypothetical protein
MKLIALSAAIEGITGLVLIIDPPLLGRLLLGADLSGAGEAVGRVAGFALLALAVACWPKAERVGLESSATRALFAYNTLAAAFFLYLGARGAFVGVLLWPAAALHGVLAILFARLLPQT